MSDSVASLGGVVVAPDGTITYDFDGHVHAKGLDLDSGTAVTPPDVDRIRWLRTSDGAVVANVYAYTNLPTDASAVVVGSVNPDAAGDFSRLRALSKSVGFHSAMDVEVGAVADVQTSRRILDSLNGSDFYQLVGATRQVRYHGRIALAAFPPAGPVDGDLVDVVMDDPNGIVWRFLYRAASASAFKWEFVGGPPLTYYGAAIEAAVATAGAYADVATLSVTSGVLTRAGDYTIEWGLQGICKNAPNVDMFAGIKRGGAATVDADACKVTFTTNPGWNALHEVKTFAGWVAGDAAKLQFKTTAGCLGTNAFLKISPIRVS